MTRDQIVAHLVLHGWDVGVSGWVKVTFFNHDLDQLVQQSPTGIWRVGKLSHFMTQEGGHWDQVQDGFLRHFADYLGVEGYDE